MTATTHPSLPRSARGDHTSRGLAQLVRILALLVLGGLLAALLQGTLVAVLLAGALAVTIPTASLFAIQRAVVAVLER